MEVICVSGKIEIAHISSKVDITDISEQLISMKQYNLNIKESFKTISESLYNVESIVHHLIGNIKLLKK
jgi:GTP cyclohydrolase III